VTLPRLERYYDGAPREHAEAQHVGGFTVFVGEPGGWTFSARPTLQGTEEYAGEYAGEYDAAAVAALVSRMSELDLTPALEWIHETTPSLRDAVLAEGSLVVEETPLMVLEERRASRVPSGITVRMLEAPDDEVFVAFNAVARVAFDDSAPDDAGSEARDAARRPLAPQATELLRAGRARVAVAEHPEHGVVAGGRHIARDGVTEIVAVATLPAFRRTGLAAAVTDLLIGDAHDRGCDTVFLTASSPAVAALYRGLGFTEVATGYAAFSAD
jgi:ribosomal protein S18 acetylase RimI-like enzyme